MMIKAIIAGTIFTLLAANAYATDLNDRLLSTKLSNNVEGTYFANDGTVNATAYFISTGHTQGNRAYATSNLATDIYKKDYADPQAYASDDLLDTEPSTYSSDVGTILGDTWSLL